MSYIDLIYLLYGYSGQVYRSFYEWYSKADDVNYIEHFAAIDCYKLRVEYENINLDTSLVNTIINCLGEKPTNPVSDEIANKGKYTVNNFFDKFKTLYNSVHTYYNPDNTVTQVGASGQERIWFIDTNERIPTGCTGNYIGYLVQNLLFRNYRVIWNTMMNYIYNGATLGILTNKGAIWSEAKLFNESSIDIAIFKNCN